MSFPRPPAQAPDVKPLELAVAGCGPAGLAAALLLARDGHRVTLFERFAAPRPIGSGLMLQPTGLAALERLVLRAPVEALGARIDGLHGLNERGGLVFDLRYGDLAPGLYALDRGFRDSICIFAEIVFDAVFIFANLVSPDCPSILEVNNVSGRGERAANH